ncbi:MAG TPA: helix-turn-helix transcriptional regulator [Gammaproteobacteria bacterium]|nr:helix-turn-helix transcriptional regulator [Gammaproteobacteria bacterium]
MRRRQLSDFLKGCRARLTPARAGLPDTGRRRTPGLRREDVAALAGVSVTWYTWLEQGRDIRVSAPVLERIAATLAMSPTEREFLFALVQQRPAPPVASPAELLSPSLARMLEAISVPALVMTSRWDVIAWNELTRIFRDYDELPPERRNLLRIVMVEDDSYRSDLAQFEEIARRVLSKFRVDYSQTPDSAAFEELVAELTEKSPTFRRLWNSPEVMSRLAGVGRYPHLGGISFEHSSYVPEGSPTLRLVIYTPHDRQTAEKIAAWHARPTTDKQHWDIADGH